jgi:redox-sensing transcriptional repressor
MITNKNYIVRLSNYRNALKRLHKLGFIRVFSDNLADAVGVSSSQVRKDFSLFGITGNKKGGYHLDELSKKLDSLLGKDKVQKVVLVGAGKIGEALINYKAFEPEGIRIVAAFDADEKKVNRKAEIPVLPIDKLKDYIRKNKIEIAIIAVPENAAQQVLDEMIEAGIKGVLNFAPIHLRGKEDTIINSANLRLELENVIYFVNALDKTKKKK